ncbi:hypothetical protein P9112_007072 [Eukaryota sp. TZLM1-RC]
MPRKRDIAWDYVIELSCDDSDPDCTINLDSPEVIPIENNYTHQCVPLRASLHGISLWLEFEEIYKCCYPVLKLLKLFDCNTPLSAEILYLIEEAKIEMINYDGIIIADERKNLIIASFDDRTSQLITDFYVASAMLNPKNYLPERLNFAEQLFDISKFQDFVLKVTSYDSDKALDLLRQFSVFQRFNNHTSFGRPLALAGREKENFNAMVWWQQFGYDAPELQKLALQVVSQFVSASAVERLWSLHDWIHSKRRNRLTEERVKKLIAVYNFLASCRQEEDSEEDNKTEDCIEILNVCCQLLEEED